MKLTKSDRQAFVLAVLDDLPTVDYQALARKKITDWSVRQMPEELQAQYEKHPEYFKMGYFHMPGSLHGVNAVSKLDYNDNESVKRSDPEFYAELKELDRLNREQNSRRQALENQLIAAIASVTTLKRAKEVLPEFEKYLPADRDSVVDRSMPIVSNLISALSEAGWPKDAPLNAGAAA